MKYFDYWFEPDYKMSIQDAYILGNVFSFNYVTKDKITSNFVNFLSFKKKQDNNSTGWEYSIESFKQYGENVQEFLRRDENYSETEFKVLDYNSSKQSDLVRKPKSNERFVYFTFNFEKERTYKEFVILSTGKITGPLLLASFLRGMFDSRGSIDWTTKKLTIDMDRTSSHEQALLLGAKMSQYLPETKTKLNYNPRNNQPGALSRLKNPQARFNLEFYMSRIGTYNPQLVDRFMWHFEEFGIDIPDYEYYKNLFVFSGDFNFGKKQKERISELAIDDLENKKRAFSNMSNKKKVAIKTNKTMRRILRQEEKEMLFIDVFKNQTIDGKNADFSLVRWHHAIPEYFKKSNENIFLNNFIDSDQNFVPLLSTEHDLLHTPDQKLNTDNIEKKIGILNDIFSYISKYDEFSKNITYTDFIEIYK